MTPRSFPGVSNQTIFNSAKEEYEAVLRNRGPSPTLMFTRRRTRKKNRQKNTIWFNPPHNKNVKTNIGKIFLKLVDKHFPKSNKFHKIFSRNTLKVSYSSTENMAQIIKKHNKKITNTAGKSTASAYNRRIKTKCPLNGNCLQPSVIYQATAKSKDNLDKICIGVTERPWKQRRCSHKLSLTSRECAHIIALSKYLWDLKTKTKTSQKYHGKSRNPHQPTTRRKTMYSLFRRENGDHYLPRTRETLNERSELISNCGHEEKFLSHYYDSKD